MSFNSVQFDFSLLVSAIRQVDENLATQASRAVNMSLTLRNWLIGAYIGEYELSGADRASYGDSLINELSKELRRHKMSNSGQRQLYSYLAFYRAYPAIIQTVPEQTRHLLPKNISEKKVRTVSAQLITTPPRT
ncbi:MAG: DUF1016 family protein, partial [Candidatus Electrothrix sp. AUS4]|nr:DUF1016 family protein [Candidatus Electrothrix sp. AUS4]